MPQTQSKALSVHGIPFSKIDFEVKFD